MAMVMSVLTLPSGFGQSGTAPAPPSAPAVKSDEPLLTRTPFDRLLLKDGFDVAVEALAPRPLPPAKKYTRRPPSRKKSAELEAREKEIEKDPSIRLFVMPVEGDGIEYAVYRDDITDIIYFEDMLLQEADRLIAAGDYPKAFEYVLFVQNRDPKWRGLADTHRRLLLAEARVRFDRGDLMAGLQFVNETLARNAKDEQASSLALEGLGKLGEIDLSARRFERARESQARMKSIDSTSPAAKSLADKLREVAKSIMGQAPGDRPERLDLLNEAYRAWPETEGLAGARSDAMSRWPTVNVAVQESIVESPKPWAASPAQARIVDLTFRPLLESLRETSYKGEPPNQLAARFELIDLTTGEVTLKDDARWSDGRLANARDVVATLTSWAQPSSPAYHGTWSGLIESVHAVDDRKVRVKFVRPVLQPDFWFLNAMMPAETAFSASVSREAWIGSGDYRWLGSQVESELPESTFQRQPGKEAGPFRVRELVFEDDREAWQALIDGRVDMVDHVPADLPLDRVPQTISVATRPAPEVHVIAVDGRVPLLSNRSFRRGLAYAMNRQELFEEQFLGRAPRPDEFLADGAFARGTAWDDTEVRPVPFDPAMARLLFASAKRELKVTKISLTLDHSSRPDIVRVAAKVADSLSGFGIEVKLKRWSEGELEEALRSGRPFELAWRTVKPTMDHFLVGGMISPAIYAPPETGGLAALASPMILSQVLDLERGFVETEVRAQARFIDRLVRQELPLIPLWQVPRRYAWRKDLTGVQPNTERLYVNVREWSIRASAETRSR
jgi:peptide/nickel transport system substrate-binding protein